MTVNIPTIIKNQVQCVHCQEVIESTPERECVACSCGLALIAGGNDRLVRFGACDDMIEMAQFSNSSDRH